MRKINLAKCPIIDLPVDQVRPYDRNPRVHPERQLQMIEASFRKFGMINPVLVGPDNILIAGHGRLIVARRLGMTSIPALRLPHLSDAEVRAFRIADNQIAAKAEWSIELLAGEIELIASLDLDFDPLEIGMETGEIDFLIDSAKQSEAEELAPPPVAEPDRSRPAVSRVGDIFTIGRHKVICGDARDPSVYRAVLGDRRADAVISDQPWNLRSNFISGHGEVRHPDFVMAAGEMSDLEFDGFTQLVVANQANFAAPGALCLQFIDWRSADVMIRAGKKHVGELVNICVWVKHSAGMGSLWRSQHELCCAFRVGSGKSKNNVQLGVHGRDRSNVWRYPAPTGFGSERRKLQLHPTCKNEKMIGDAIMDITDRNDVILDAFLGSGTTILSAHDTGRVGIGIELDPVYVDLAIGRIAEATGKPARHLNDCTFDELRDQRAAGKEG